jgi:hypothetical protein
LRQCNNKVFYEAAPIGPLSNYKMMSLRAEGDKPISTDEISAVDKIISTCEMCRLRTQADILCLIGQTS